MQEIWSFGGVIALWLGISVGLWWLHRRSVHGRQRRELDQAERAVVFVAEAPAVFEAIRTQPAPKQRSADPQAQLTADTHGLLKRIQDHGAFFDRVNALRVQMQASFGVDDYQPLSEILQVRRDLWASSEIVLVEDLSSFGSSFAEEGAYERFRDEAVDLMFKAPAGAAEDDVIDLRLSLAREDAERFVVELKDAIAAARERDRLPTPAEIIAYPVAAIRALPEKLRITRNFAAAFFAYSGDIARSIRDSETMERGRRHLQTAREELPQRLSAGFERASTAALERAGNLKRHYDFLVAAHDFQAKYERVLSRAPELTERGRQFIARLDLAEKSERLRLTSANVLIWVARRLIDVLAHFIAGLQILYGALSRTTLWAFAEAMVAPTPVRGRQTSAFLSFQMALAASGMSEDREPIVAPLEKPAVQAPKAKSASKRAAAASAKSKSPAQKAKTPAPAPKGKVQPAPAKVKSGEKTKVAAAKEIARTPAKVKPAEPAKVVATPVKADAVPPPPAKAKPAAEIKPPPLPRQEPVVQQAAAATPARGEARAAPVKPVVVKPPAPAPAAKPEEKEPLKIIPKVAKPAVVDLPEPKPVAEKPVAEPSAPLAAAAVPEPVSIPEPIPSPAAEIPQPAIAPIAAETEKRPSFFASLFGGGKPAVVEPLEQPLPEPQPGPEPEFADIEEMPGADIETKPTLLARLSEIGNDTKTIAADASDSDEESPEVEPEDDTDDATDEAGPLTLSLMDLQTKDPQKPSPIRSFPWLRGY